MQDWWVDLAVLGLLLFFGYFWYRVQAGSIGNLALDAIENRSPEVDGRKWSLYPRRLIRQAGYLPRQVIGLYWAGKALLAVLLPLLVLDLTQGRAGVLLPLLASASGFFAVDLWLAAQRQRRQAQITGSLSFFISLMVVYLQSGMNLTQAIQQAARYGLARRNPLAQEVLLLNREIEAGLDRHSGFKRLAERTGVDDLQRLASVIRVGLKVGSPVRDSLSAQAELLRSRQSQMATQILNRKSMESMLPMLMVSFPMFLVLVFFPAAMQVFDVLGMLKDLF